MSVVIPNYNYGHYLATAVQSVLSQAGVRTEVIIVDDASTDDSVSIATRLASSDSRVRVITRSLNGGPVATFNEGLAAATGEYLVRLDADDLLTPGSLGRSTAVAEAYPGVGFVYGHPVHFSGPVPVRHRRTAASWTVWPGRNWLELRCRLGVNCITSPEVLMRMSLVHAVGGQRALAHTHDMEMWFRLAWHADVAWINGADQAWHREHADSLSAREVDVLTDLRERAAAFDLLFEPPAEAEDRPRAESLLRTAHTALANEAVARAAQSYSAGHGNETQTELLLGFAAELDVPPASIEHLPVLRRAQRLGHRAKWSPYLFTRAVAYRGTREIRSLRWRSTGL
ncbi:glycosyltransferase family 2 protein [Cryobacterium arcticum]|uniref:glycosyltransferase family 2 protein n=1 Tax=Cryobacterium arcticum TaxID=670052 RepID=UPI001AD7EE3D|nr:glycosyltransferase family 2 protein [Cryobacterium arcticum]